LLKNFETKPIQSGPLIARRPGLLLILLFARSFAVALSRQSFLQAAFLAGLQVEGMPFDIVDDVFGLNFSFEPA
jgi:hypothetical protein